MAEGGAIHMHKDLVVNNKMHVMVRERLRPQFQEAGRQSFDMAGLAISDVQHFEGYDASSFHLIN